MGYICHRFFIHLAHCFLGNIYLIVYLFILIQMIKMYILFILCTCLCKICRNYFTEPSGKHTLSHNKIIMKIRSPTPKLCVKTCKHSMIVSPIPLFFCQFKSYVKLCLPKIESINFD